MKYIHLECLRGWLDSKRHSRETKNVNSYFWKNIECELCKTLFPESITYKGNLIRILNYKIPEDSNYVVLETYVSLKSKARIYHVVNFKKDENVIVGRGQEANVRITDISVSRVHSKLSYSDGKFYMLD